MSSVGDLNRCLRVTNPAAWILIGAVSVLLIAGIIWGSMGTIPLTSETVGVVKDGQVVCFLPLNDDAKATVDSKAMVEGIESKIVYVGNSPYSEREVQDEVGNDYAIDSMGHSGWSYKIIIEMPIELMKRETGDDVPVQIVTEEIAPLASLFAGAK